jgi:hypothetical protein
MANYRNPLLLLPYLCLMIPLNIYVAGSQVGAVMQWALFRNQQLPGADVTLVAFTRDLSLVLAGTLAGRSALGVLVWFSAICLFTGSFVITLIGLVVRNRKNAKAAALLCIVSGLLFLLSDVIRYGLTLQGPSGFCVPVGIPLLLVSGWWAYRSDPFPETVPGPVATVPSGNPVRIFSITLPEIDRGTLKNDLLILVLISLIVKMLVLSSALTTLLSILPGDMTLYYWYAHSILLGKIPYISFNAEYPQLFFVPVVLAILPFMGNPDFTSYLFSFGAITIAFDIATLVCVYVLAARFFGQEKAFLSGLLYTTAISVAFFIPIVYDIIPTFFLVFSLCCFIYGKDVTAYVSAAVGVLLKWFPFAGFPFFYLSTKKNGRELNGFRTGVIVTILLFAACSLPFILIDAGKFFRTYMFHILRPAEAHSFIYYMDAVSLFLINLQPVSKISFLLFILAECVLLYWYYRHLDGTALTLTYALFLSVFAFVLFNKVLATYYIIWLTPFLALLLARSAKHILLFYLVQIIMFLETPVLLRIVYTPYKDYFVIENSTLSVSFVFYTVKFAIFFILLYVIVRDVRRLQDPGGRTHIQTES